MRPDLSVRVGPLLLENPVMTASGTFGFGTEYRSLMDVEALGAVVTKGVSLQPRPGNRPPRIWETPSGMLNSVGLENPGLEEFLRVKLPALAGMRPRVIVNIFGASVEEFSELAARLEEQPRVDGLEVNISCPNVSRGGVAFGAHPQLAAEVTAAVRRRTRKALLVKLTPNVTDLTEIARRVAEAGADGLTLINTLRAMAIDWRTGRVRLGNVIGGLSGPAIRPVAVRAVYEVSRTVKIPLVGCGGICTWQDAVEFFRAGASAVQVGSATFRNPRAANEVLLGIEKFLTDEGMQSIGQLVGRVELEP